MNNQEHIESIISETFRVIQEVYDYQKETDEGAGISSRQSRIIFPVKRDGEVRISEQELKFVFVEQLNLEIKKGWDVFYSVETPTKDTYRFSNVDMPKSDSTGLSANFDLVIHDRNFKRIALIEFKANNPSKYGYQKDFVKLNNSKEYGDGVLRYFIELVKSASDRTISSLCDKIRGSESIFRCYSLTNGEITSEIQSLCRNVK